MILTITLNPTEMDKQKKGEKFFCLEIYLSSFLKIPCLNIWKLGLEHSM